MQNIRLPVELIESKIYLIRGKKVMIDKDIARLYGVETKVLNQAVRRNKKRFPDDFMFQMNEKEIQHWKFQFGTSNHTPSVNSSLRSQIVTLKRGQHIKYLPMVFTEQGVAMLSSVLRSERAIQVNIQIMRTFTKIREMLATNKELRDKIGKLEKKYDQKFQIVFKVIKKLLSQEEKPKSSIGYRI